MNTEHRTSNTEHRTIIRALLRRSMFEAQCSMFLVFLFASPLAPQAFCAKTSGASSGAAIDSLLANPALWQMTRPQFAQQAQPFGFRWVSAAQDTAQTTEHVTLFQIPTWQSIARFDGEKMKELSVLFYNRGDAGEITKEQFDALLKQAAEALSAFTKVKPVARGKDATSAVHAEGVDWKMADADYLLEYSSTKENKAQHLPFRAEFVRLSIRPIQKSANFVAASIAARDKAKFVGPMHVKKEATGDVHLEGVPMVDQGQKGYCVVASTERVIRYYGGKADEHELAEIANSSSSGGTSVNAMIDSLKKLSQRLRVKVRTVEAFDIPQIQKLFAEYNRVAKRAKQAELPPLGHMIDVQGMYTAMDGELLREARTKNPSEMSRFQRQVAAHIDQGVPLLWSVMLGKLPEKGIPQNAGGHMRLIIGYNSKTNEILYSDSWGMGHELKRMSAADAWTMTTGVYSIEPLGS